jgi:putative FmdB family regulatory protein
VPIYVFHCDSCSAEHELLRPLGDTTPPACPDCGGTTRHRLSRVAVNYDAFGFTATDKLVANPDNKDFRALKAKAQEIADS